MTDVDQRVAAQIAALRAEYVAQLSGRVRELVSALDAAAEHSDATQLFQCYRLAHGLAGSAGIYGFGEVSAEARALELLIKPFAEARIALAPSDIDRARQQLVALDRAALAAR